MASIGFKLVRDDISPKLAKLAASAKHPEKVFRSMGTTFMSITMGNFNNAGAQYRPKPWAAKKDGSASMLQRSGTLARSFHLTVTDKSATVSNPTIYAATHQFGSKGHELGKKVGSVKTKYANKLFKGSWNDVLAGGKGTPPRPFFPVENGKLTPAAEDLIARAGQRAIERQL